MATNTHRAAPSRRPSTTLALALVLGGLLGACGGVEGTYTHEETVPELGTAKISLQLKGGGEAVMTMTSGMNGATESAKGTYTASDDKVTVTIQGDDQVFTRKGDKLIGKGFGETIEFVKE